MVARKIVGFVLLVGFIVFLVPGEGLAKTRTIKCKSEKGKLHNCKVKNLDETSVRLIRKLKNSADCINGRTWGTQPGLIWVESDCRAEFEYRKESESGRSDRGQGPRDLDDLVGARASSGERELEDRGYRHRKTTKIGNSSIAYWWNSRRGHCIAATTKDGRYSSILEQPDTMCDEDRARSRRDHGDGHGSLNDLVDMRASKGERELEDQGYRHRKTVHVGGNSVDYWWNRRKQHCIAVTTKDGRYSSVMDQPESMCD